MFSPLVPALDGQEDQHLSGCTETKHLFWNNPGVGGVLVLVTAHQP